MNILIIGSGGREHAIAHKFSLSQRQQSIFVAPGNDGMKDVATCVPINIDEHEQLINFAKTHQIDLTVVGPEQALANGIVDVFNKAGLKIFGPTKAASMIESSKQYAKELMKKYNIPTASYEVFNDYNQALHYVQKKGVPIVIKADGLAAGKGVVVAFDEHTANTALDEMLNQHKYKGSNKVVIEEYLVGEEFSLMAFVNGDKAYPMVIAQDHKRIYDNDQGPNTGGMGAYSPVPHINEKIVNQSINDIILKTAKALVKEKRPFTGVLYGGLILTSDGPKVIEFNARFGDPETEVVLPRLKNDLDQVMIDILEDRDVNLQWSNHATLGVVLASKGYPIKYQKGHEIKGLNLLEELTIYHMGTKIKDDKVFTNGGRVMMLVKQGENLEEIKHKLYKELEKINCNSLVYRSDIGDKAINKY